MQNDIQLTHENTGEVEQVLRTEVLVVGGGPAGAAAGFWLARLGHDVTVIERKKFPREKTCGDGLTPRAVKELGDMGLSDQLSQFHRYEGLRATAHGKALELKWPTHPIYPQYGYVVRRRELDMMVARNAQDAGAKLLEEHEAISPIKLMATHLQFTPNTGLSLMVRTRDLVAQSEPREKNLGRTVPRFVLIGRARDTTNRGLNRR